MEPVAIVGRTVDISGGKGLARGALIATCVRGGGLLKWRPATATTDAQDRFMGSFSLMHWVVVLAIVLILFGAGKMPRVMGDFAKGIKALRPGLNADARPGAAVIAPVAHPAFAPPSA